MWSLYSTESGKTEYLEPLVFSNRKNQEDIVKEVLMAIKEGYKIIFIKGVCGTGKSAIALNLAKEVGRASIVVPIKNLQKQYEQDYTNKKFLLKNPSNNQKLILKVMTGRANHICPFLQEAIGSNLVKSEKNSKLSDFNIASNESIVDYNEHVNDLSCDNPSLPCKIQIKEKNIKQIKEYLKQNPKVNVHDFANVSLRRIRRMSIAPVCPYWSPIVPSEIELNLDADCKKYAGLQGKQFTFYQRKQGCSYYSQFNSYLNADIIVFNSQKYKLETLMDRKPLTDMEIIDECDEFLDSFSNHETINLNRLNFALGALFPENSTIDQMIIKLIDLTKNILKNKKIEESILNEKIFHIKNTKIFPLLKYFLDSDLLENVECDEENYCYHVDEAARTFEDFFDEAYVSFYKEEKDIIAKIVTTNLKKRFKELLDKNKIIVMMSGTIHSENVLKNIFGLQNFKIIEAETKMPGEITCLKTGREINCKYDNFQKRKVTRQQYLFALAKCIEQAEKPVLVHVNAFKDLPTEQEIKQYGLSIISREKLKYLQAKDKVGEQADKFKQGKISVLYSTKCNRGVDFPGAICNSIILTKYPYPNISSLFWRILKRTNPQHYSEFYRDKAKRELLQRIYRGLRSRTDHIFLLSPDLRVLQIFS